MAEQQKKKEKRAAKNGERTERSSAVVKAFKAARRKDGTLKCDVCGWTPPPGLRALYKDKDIGAMVHAHHVRPIACGGADEASNLVLLCPTHHACAHRMGTMKRNEYGTWWDGPQTPDHLLYEMRLMASTKREDKQEWAQYVKSGRRFWKVLQQREQDAIDDEIRRNRAFTVVDGGQERPTYGTRRSA